MWFCGVAGEHRKKLLPKIFPHVYIILRLRHKQFSGETEENNNIIRNEIRSDILKLLTFLSADAKSAVFLYFVAAFYQIILPDLIHEQLEYVSGKLHMSA